MLRLWADKSPFKNNSTRFRVMQFTANHSRIFPGIKDSSSRGHHCTGLAWLPGWPPGPGRFLLAGKLKNTYRDYKRTNLKLTRNRASNHPVRCKPRLLPCDSEPARTVVTSWPSDSDPPAGRDCQWHRVADSESESAAAPPVTAD